MQYDIRLLGIDCCVQNAFLFGFDTRIKANST